MGSYTFTWAHPASEVFVTGDFDNWQKTIKLEHDNGVFKKTVEMPKTKHLYKFVVDGVWLTNETHAKEEVDNQGIYNNVLHPHDIEDVSILSSAAPEASTAFLAGAVPKQKATPAVELPGAFPLTPGNEPEFNTFGVAPIPATAGAGNPIHLAPGEAVPHPSTLTSNTVDSTVKTDAASYEKSDALAPQLGPVIPTPEAASKPKGSAFTLSPLAGHFIPESSLSSKADNVVGTDTGVTIQSAAPLSSTAALAAEVPKEPRGVPSTVVKSQKEAHFPPEAAANPLAVLEKNQVEDELKETIPEKPATADGSISAQDIGVAAVGGLAAAGATAVSAATQVPDQLAAARDSETAAQAAAGVKETAAQAATGVQDAGAYVADQLTAAKESEAAHEAATAAKEAGTYVAGALTAAGATVAGAFVAASQTVQETAAKTVGLNGGLNGHATTTDVSDAVPEVVAESLQEAHASPEAAANTEAVIEKSEFEAELLKEVERTDEAGEPAPTFTAATTETAPALQYAASDVPEVVAESQHRAHVSPEASANAEAVEEKKEYESELLNEVSQRNESGEPAPVITGATHAIAPASLTTAREVPDVVADSLKQAHTSPEAAANSEAVAEKKQVESQLVDEVVKTNKTGEAAPVIASAPVITGITHAIAPASLTTAREVPDVVAESQKEAHTSPEAAANSEAVAEKKLVESQLVDEVAKTNETGEAAPVIASAPVIAPTTGVLAEQREPYVTADEAAAAGLNAPASHPAQIVNPTSGRDSRDVSPMSKPITNDQTQPIVTTGAQSTTIPAKTEATIPAQTEATTSPKTSNKETGVAAPATSENLAPSPATDKKTKRMSFFGKLKAKLKDL